MNQSAKPRVLLVNWRDPKHPEAGGAEVHLHEVATRLCNDGFTCIQYSHRYAKAPAFEQIDGVQLNRVGHRLFFNFTVWFCLRSWIRKHQIDVVIDDSNKIPFFIPLFSPVPVIAQIHHLFGTVIFKEAAFPMALYVYFFEQFVPYVYKKVPVLTGSKSTQQEFLRLGMQNVSIAPEGVAKHYHIQPGIEKQHGLIVYIGRIKRYKGLDTLLKAFSQLLKNYPHAHFIIAGSGDDQVRLSEIASRLQISEKVTFLGFVSEEKKVELYTKAWFAVNSSLKEGWGLTSIEANACGTPMLATQVPGLCDSVKDGETGFLVPFGDSKAFISAMDRLLKDRELHTKMCQNCLAWAAQHSWEGAYAVTRQKILDVYRMNGTAVEQQKQVTRI